MFWRFFAVFLLVAANNVPAVQFPLEIVENFDGTRVVVLANKDEIETAPTWHPADKPPLTIADLVITVQKHIDATPGRSNALIRKIDLRPIKGYETQDRWYYLLMVADPDNSHPNLNYLAVLMNGKVLSTIREPSAYK